MKEQGQEKNVRTMKPGQDLAVAGCIGQEGTKALIRECFPRLSSWFSRSYLERAFAEPETPVSRELLEKLGAGEMEEVGEGGILKAIWDLTGACRTGAYFYLRRIPVRQRTIEVCERLSVNPYRLFSGNCLLFSADNGGQVVEALSRQGIPAAVIGRITGGIAREIRDGEETGYLERPKEDELTRILGRERAEE